MLIVGICDDNLKDRERIQKFCQIYFRNRAIEYRCMLFSSGEELLEYSYKKKNDKIDVLFLDMEMEKIDGLSVRNEFEERDFVKRIIFVTSHKEDVFMAFGLKVMAFAVKPVTYEQVENWLRDVLKEARENITIVYEGMNGPENVETEKIEYIKAMKNYTELHLHLQIEGIFVPQNMKYWEELLKGLPFLRVHKSYIVNLQHVADVAQEIKLRSNDMKISVGRTYRDKVRTRYFEFTKEKVRRRI